MPCTCSPTAQTFQPMPTKGKLVENLNLSVGEVASILSSDAPGIAYCYVMTTIANNDGRMVQRGSGPNIEGGFITLCTCKRWMRSYREPDDWVDVWVIGMSTVEAGLERAVFYMMKVMKAYGSQLDLWMSDLLPSRTKNAKAAHMHQLGDIFHPVGNEVDPFDPKSYKRPIAEHSHEPHDEWHNDIDYVGSGGRRAAYLVGDPEYSFIWEFPRIIPRFDLGRGQKKIGLDEFTDYFKAGY